MEDIITLTDLLEIEDYAEVAGGRVRVRRSAPAILRKC